MTQSGHWGKAVVLAFMFAFGLAVPAIADTIVYQTDPTPDQCMEGYEWDDEQKKCMLAD
jgi:hypothetical protein